jgi:hypothetical protein
MADHLLLLGIGQLIPEGQRVGQKCFIARGEHRVIPPLYHKVTIHIL